MQKYIKFEEQVTGQQLQQSVFKGNLILYLIADNHAARPGTKRVGHLVGYVLIT